MEGLIRPMLFLALCHVAIFAIFAIVLARTLEEVILLLQRIKSDLRDLTCALETTNLLVDAMTNNQYSEYIREIRRRSYEG